MNYTLKMMKDALYTGPNPVLYARGKNVTEEDFLDLLFSPDFYSKSFQDENGESFSLETILCARRNGGNAQRNKVFTGKYEGFRLELTVLKILEAKPELLLQLCGRCEAEIKKAKDDTALRALITEIGNVEIRGKSVPFYNFVSIALDNEVRLAFAAVLLYLLIQGEVNGLLPVLEKSKVFAGQFDYMLQTISHLKNTFAIRSVDDDFAGVLKNFYDPFASLLSCVTTVEKEGRTQSYDHLLNDLYDTILDAKDLPIRKILRIRGASGTDKNALTQLLYLRLANETRSGYEEDYAPFYLNLNHYCTGRYACADDAKKQLELDAEPFLHYCKTHPSRIPILFVDGVKKYELDDFNLDYCLSAVISELPNTRFVVAIEDGLVINSRRQRDPAAFAAGRFLCYVKMEPLYLPGRDEAMRFLESFTKIYGGADPESIYNNLRRIGFQQIDTYQLRMCLGKDFGNLSRAGNLAHLYQLICNERLAGEQTLMEQGEQWAFDFAYTSVPLPPVPRALKRLLSAHDSLQEFFIARWYLSRLRDESLNANELSMVMPKGVTRFVVPMLNRFVEDENNILDLIEREYPAMDVMAKSEMTYWLGRIKAPSLAARTEDMLMRYYREQTDNLANMPHTGEWYRNSLFLLRGISVSLIVKGRVDILNEYITSLIHNETANEINRGFHLEYYGDKPYLPIYNTLTFMDDVTTGKRTLDQLITANEQSISSGRLPHIFALNLFTICSLLQVRTEFHNPNITFDVEPYLEKACRQIDSYLHKSRRVLPIFREYLMMVQRDFRDRIKSDAESWNNIAAESYNTYSRRIYRTGWVDRGIQAPETDAEHMYHAWMMAMMFLPKELPNHPEYSKDSILKLLLIHDIAEVITGDIPKPEKAKNPEKHKRDESDEMGIYLLRGSYSGLASTPEYYEVWKMWYDEKSLNGRIAHEIDIIQTLHQLLTYAAEQPGCFTDDGLQRWLDDDCQEICTGPGIDILQSVIMKNKKFRPILERLGLLDSQSDHAAP